MNEPVPDVNREPVDADLNEVQAQLLQLALGRVAVRTPGDAVDYNLGKKI
jgi:hypothetical protein